MGKQVFLCKLYGPAKCEWSIIADGCKFCNGLRGYEVVRTCPSRREAEIIEVNKDKPTE